MNKYDLIDNIKVKDIYKLTGPVEHWLTTFNCFYWAFTKENLDDWQAIKEGDIFFFHGSRPEYLSGDAGKKIKGLEPGIIGIGIASAKKYEKTGIMWKEEFLNGNNIWPYVIHFSEIFWFGDVTKIRNVPIERKSDMEIAKDAMNLSKNAVSFKKMKRVGYQIPAQGSYCQLSSDGRDRLSPLVGKSIFSAISIKDDFPDEELLDKIPYSNEVEDEIEKAIKKPNYEGSLDIKTVTQARKEQAYLRKFHFANKTTSECGICGREFPVMFLVTAHIKKRALCTEEEKNDLDNITIPMCEFGCDALYENGYIGVKEGIVVILKKNNLLSTLEKYMKNLEGRKCSYWNTNTQIYFQFHLEYHA